MPFYKVEHTYPLSAAQRQSVATAITNLHCAAFDTPAFFVHVSFAKHEAGSADDGTYFMAGKPHSDNSNRIVAMVRSSPGRTKADWDKLAADIEGAWDDAVGIRRDGAPGAGLDEAKRLLMVVFTPMVAIREGGMAIPEAGHEAAWLKEQIPYFKTMSEVHGVQDFTDMLEELRHREAFKGLLE
ncbi:hypothetical protein CkaCkLH20_08203 [Colletotrichum karsti]|uniref:Tautomerase cis-CaaD-like domain-containing protein n=1 Tax=Colletotrichum karsti TaxID=1095194 RepID=A0A9P6I1Q8_9PEZI|nr:uncharacterized protein CkaCkLH20_08203 [Colletotrichum karsti]KAF9874220.1 hypothetical protein CkaCkLH20_08203 [Colletotrichum karsti]